MSRLKDRGTSVLLITHRIDDIYELADWVSVMKNGEIITTSISKKNTVTKIENVAEKTIIYVNGEKNPFLTIQNKIIDFEPDKTDKDKFSLTLPLSKGMRWGSSVNDRNDGYYGWEVEATYDRKETTYAQVKKDAQEYRIAGARVRISNTRWLNN